MFDAPCVLCTLDNVPLPANPDPYLVWLDTRIRSRATRFAAECGGSPDQLDHYAWHHLSSVPGFWADNGPWEQH